MRLKLLAVAVSALAPVVAMLAYSEYSLREQRAEEVRLQAAQTARQASSEVERIIEGLRSMLVAVTSMPSVRSGNVPECNEALQSLAVNVPNIGKVFVLSPEGRPVCGSIDIATGTSFGDRAYFQDAVKTKAFVVGNYTKSRISDEAVIPLAMPLLKDGVVKSVVVTGLRLGWLQSRITERGVAPGNAVTVADSAGTIVSRVPFPERFIGTVIPRDFLKLVHADAPGTVEVQSQDGTRRVLGYRPIVLPATPLYVSAGFSTSEAFAPINRATIYNSIGIAIGAVVALLLSFYMGKRFILSPISRISDVMERWRRGETDARTMMSRRDELHAVGASLDGLLDELDYRRVQAERAEEERTLLVRELAHRVKNGFALVQAIARQTFWKSDPDRYRSFSDRLMALAGTYDLILSKESSASTVEATVHAALSAHASETSRISISGPSVALSPDLALPLSLVVHELATNATKYGSLSRDDGTVDIVWSTQDQRLRLFWQEAGGPVVAAPQTRGFGSTLIERAFPAAALARSQSDFRPEGLFFELDFTLDQHPLAGDEA